VLFLLTTNRADLIEPALATRPGRVDLALEIPLPDETARAKLVRLYAQDVPLDEATERDLVARTEGLSGAFIKELMRQAALRAALEDRSPTGADATEALTELLEERSTMTRWLLGEGADGSDAPEPCSSSARSTAGVDAHAPLASDAAATAASSCSAEALGTASTVCSVYGFSTPSIAPLPATRSPPINNCAWLIRPPVPSNSR
jgi:hypothetical protein